MASVREQAYGGPVEHVAVDGGSTDATMDIVRSAGLRHVSEPDAAYRAGRAVGRVRS